MGRDAHRLAGRSALFAAALAILLCGGCLGVTLGPPAYRYFATPKPNDAWSRKIAQWQQRERDAGAEAVLKTPAAVAGSAGGEAATEAAGRQALRSKFEAFLAEQRRAQAREVAAWIQDVAQQHYIPDGPIDRWATLEETFRHDGDDCDGLELLTYNLLRELGFGDDEVFRAIVFRRSDGQHHMVTFWFEQAGDPWEIDPTGAMTSGMPRMSEVPGWEPLKVFSEQRDFDVVRAPAELHAAAR
jgi:predicted transglutaminase-like cysteine proteinase